MASLFDYVTSGQQAGQKAPTGYRFRTSTSGKDRYTPVNELNRSRRLTNNPGSMGGGRSNLDAQRGFSNQGIRSLPSSRQSGLFGAGFNPGLGLGSSVTSALPEEEDQFTFEDRGLGRNFVEDSSTMIKDTIVDPVRNVVSGAAKKYPFGLMGLFGRMGDSIGQNRADHRYLNSIFGRASPDKTMAFFEKAIVDANQPNRFENPMIMAMGDTSRGSSLGQAMKYFERAGITEQDMGKFMDPTSKFYGNEAYLRAMAGGGGAEDFDTGMSFIKNAKATANLARQEAMKQQADAAARGVSGEKYMGMGMMNQIDPYEGIYESPLTDDLYSENLVPVSPNPRMMNKAPYMLPRDTAAIESMGGGMNAFPLEEEELI